MLRFLIPASGSLRQGQGQPRLHHPKQIPLPWQPACHFWLWGQETGHLVFETLSAHCLPLLRQVFLYGVRPLHVLLPESTILLLLHYRQAQFIQKLLELLKQGPLRGSNHGATTSHVSLSVSISTNSFLASVRTALSLSHLSWTK